ncbi:rhomboid family intramembrane serine protease [Marinobacter halodurans]|uniref:Rhomboid family intramembrane serine protease n=1 Tax=Marinobacter halodurans TaxID=2528979 RepID=A0ABY1ZSX3_9GAMM|nr:rhomboid family intramembrane serine protease [Marinobacter halodurans]TBW59560.1 rhomboid family intramembrane serine protease [Marinobacter halodurans]
MYRVKQLPAETDLADFSQWLRQQGVEHRISEEGGQQVLWLAHQEHAEPVLAALEQFLSRPEVRRAIHETNHSPVFVNGRWQPSPRHAPMVLAIIGLAALVSWFTGLGRDPSSAALMFVDPTRFVFDTLAQRLDALTASLSQGQIWRLLTPDLLHFSWSHIIFNAVMMWFLGSQVEWFDGKRRLGILVVVVSLLSNTLQFLVSGPLFGGLSGVVYGILGYCWLSQQRRPRFQFPPALIVVSLVWILIGFTPLTRILGLGSMANEAHLGGLVAGLIMAVLMPPPRKQDTQGA